MTQKPFEPGDDVAIVFFHGWHRERFSISWRGKVEKVHKTGTVVTAKGNFRQNGSPLPSSYLNPSSRLRHNTPELEAEVAHNEATISAENALWNLADTLKKLRGDDALSMAEKLRAAGVIGGAK